jgi:hypothetical protein
MDSLPAGGQLPGDDSELRHHAGLHVVMHVAPERVGANHICTGGKERGVGRKGKLGMKGGWASADGFEARTKRGLLVRVGHAMGGREGGAPANMSMLDV